GTEPHRDSVRRQYAQLPPDLPRSQGTAERRAADLVRRFDRALGWRHAGGGHGRLQRENVARPCRTSDVGSAACDRTLLTPDTGRTETRHHDRRPRELYATLERDGTHAAHGRRRSDRIRL